MKRRPKTRNRTRREKIIFVHLKGSHNIYWRRFPTSFEKFSGRNDQAPVAESMSGEDFHTLNSYYNSIYYTDHILRELTERLKKEGGEPWMMYFSDHGREVYDFRSSRPFISTCRR